MSRPNLFLPIGILAISTASIFVKLCDAPALVIATYRMVISSIVLIPFAGYQKIWRGLEGSEMGWQFMAGLFLSLHFTFWIASLKYTSVASSVVLVTTHPIFVGLGARLFLKEPLGTPLILGILLSVLGGGLIGYGDFLLTKEAFLGDGLALLGAMSASGYFLVGRKMRRQQNLLTYIFPVYSTSGLTLVFLSLLFQKTLFGYTAKTYFFMILLAFIPQLIGHTTFNWALKYLPASAVAIAILGEPVGSTVLAYLILGERLTVLKSLGGVFILSGILSALTPFPIYRKRRKKENLSRSFI
ncbi:MAG: DMT family transporter [Thermodesulfobacteriota bacterium]